MDTSTMIDEATFEATVRRTIGKALHAYGYKFVSGGVYRVRFARATSFVEVTYDASRSHEVSVWLGETANEDEPPLELADALRTTDCASDDVAFTTLIQTSDSDALSRLLRRVARILSECASVFLTGRRDEFAAATVLRSARAAAYTSQLQNHYRVQTADAAWEEKDYGRVRDLLSPIRESLDESHRRRLLFAEKQL